MRGRSPITIHRLQRRQPRPRFGHRRVGRRIDPRQIARIGDLRAVEWPMRCGDGRTIPVSWHLSRMTGTGGEVTGVVVVGRNLVEQRAMEAQMRQAEKLAALGMAIEKKR